MPAMSPEALGGVIAAGVLLCYVGFVLAMVDRFRVMEDGDGSKTHEAG